MRIGIMDYEVNDDLQNDFESCVKWHRIAPPFNAGTSEIHLSNKILTDRWIFKSGNDWINWFDSTAVVVKKAPAAIGRGITCPKIVNPGSYPPYVIATRYPNGPIAIGTLPRTSPDRKHLMEDADVLLSIPNFTHPIGIFGAYGSLKLKAMHLDGIQGFIVQDLYTEKIYKVDSMVKSKKNAIILGNDFFAWSKKQGIRNFILKAI